MADYVVMPLAPGFEEIEAITILDVLRRAGVDVRSAALEGTSVTGAHGVEVKADISIAAVVATDVTMVVLPGGMPGADHLKKHAGVQALVRAVKARDGWTAAICAAPMALAAAQVTEGKTIACYPGFEKQAPAGRHVQDRVVVDGRVITSRGPGTALEFALTLVEKLVGHDKARELETGMLVSRSERTLEVG